MVCGWVPSSSGGRSGSWDTASTSLFTPPKDPEFPFSRSEPNEGEVSTAYLYSSAEGNQWLCGSER